MNITIHRGTHEIGGSCVEINCGESTIVIDIGMPLVNQGGEQFNIKDYEGMSGDELIKNKVLPNVSGLYKWQDKKVDGVLISHPHMDHYGFLSFVREDIPFYIGGGAKKLIDITSIFTSSNNFIKNHTEIKSGAPFTLGNFKITPYLMDHSAFDSYGFLIEAEGRKIIYSGDFRAHGRKSKAYHYFLKTAPKNVDALLLEGTMLGRVREKCITEKEIEDVVVDISKSTDGIMLMSYSAQNIDRLVSFYRAALRSGRTFVIDFYAANVLDSIRQYAKIPFPSEMYPGIRVFYPWALTNKMFESGYGELALKFRKYKIKRKEIGEDSKKVMMLVRPSMLRDLGYVKALRGGTFIYSMWKGYLSDEGNKRMLEFMEERDMKCYHVHTSGHADFFTLKNAVGTLSPKSLIPIHTFNPEGYDNLHDNVIKLKDGVTHSL
jgi:ribonuclease J